MAAKNIMTAFLSLSVLLFSTTVLADSSRHGDFTFEANIDEFDGYDRSFVYTESKTDSSRDAALIWMCMEDGLNVLYIWDKYLGGDSDDEVRVRYKIDGRDAVGPEYWGLLQGQRGGHAPMHFVKPITAEAKGGQELRIEVVDPLDGERLTDRFGLVGLSEALKRLSCAEK